MDKNSALLAELVSSAIRGRDNCCFDAIGVNWEELYIQAIKQQVYTLIYPAVKNIDSCHGPDKDLLEKWKAKIFRYGIILELNYKKVEAIFKHFLEYGIKPIMLKGFVFKTLYHQTQLRLMSDIDLLVEDKDIDTVSKILTEHGYTPLKDKKTKHIPFLHKDLFRIEIHRALTDDEIIKNKEEFSNAIWASKIKFRFKSTDIFTLSWEHQIIHMCIHMISHFVHGGFNLRQLCDLVLLVEQKTIDWNYVLEKSKEYGIHKFMSTVFIVCNRLLHLHVPVDFDIDESVDLYADKVIDDMFMGGKDIISVSENISTKKKNYTSNRLYHIFSMLFPSYDKLSRRYSYMYIKSRPYLTPVAWIHRIVYGIFRKDFNMKIKKSMLYDSNMLRIAEDRDDMLHWLEII